MTPQILILIIVAVILIYALSTHGQKEKSEADHIRDQFKMKKEASMKILLHTDMFRNANRNFLM